MTQNLDPSSQDSNHAKHTPANYDHISHTENPSSSAIDANLTTFGADKRSTVPSSTTGSSEHSSDKDEHSSMQNVDMSEVGKFTKIADEWWDKHGAFKPLHDINPYRLNWIEQCVSEHTGTGLAGKTVLDVGCGGGILTESMARRGADATGIDMGAENLEAGRIHAKQSGLTDTLRYQHIAVEELAKHSPASFDVVTCMEMLEHVPNPAQIVKACYDLLKPNGVCVLSTINRNPKSYLFAIIGAEYVLRLLDRGTHDYAKFITPAELDSMAVNAGFNRQDLIGLHYNPITKRYWLAQNVDVNYMMAVVKPKSHIK